MSKKYDYIYKIGDKINGLIIISQTRKEQKCGKKYKAYEVQSITYPNAPTYILEEYHLKRGASDGYLRGRRVFEGNSLYSIIAIRKFLVDINEAKTISPNSAKKIKVKCDNCDNIKTTTPNKLLNYGVQCVNCSNGLSFPERMFIAYLETKNIDYLHQVKFNDLKGRVFDFQIKINGVIYLVETHGEQHYLTKDKQFFIVENIQKSDNEKREYAKNNNINYIELDCRESSLGFIKESIKQCKDLPDITEEEEKNIKHLIENSAQYDIKKIIELYEKKEMSTLQIGKLFGITHNRVNSILRKNGINIRGYGKHQKLNDDLIIYDYNNGASMTSISETYNTSRQKISRILRKNNITIRNSAEQRKIKKQNKSNPS